MKRVIFAAVAALVSAPLLAWHPPKMGVKENPSPKDGKRTWPEVVAAFKATLPKCGEAWELDKKGYVCFNDMGVLDFNGTLTADEEITQLAVWSAMCSPLLTVGDRAKIRESTRKLMDNLDFQNVSQDFVARQAYPVYAKDDVYVLIKDCWGLNCPRKVVTCANFSDRPSELSVALATLELEGPATVNDVLYGTAPQKDVAGPIKVSLKPHQTRQFRVFGKKAIMRRSYTAADSVRGRMGADVQFNHVFAPKCADYRLKVTMKDKSPYSLQVNGLFVARDVSGSREFTVPLFLNDNNVRFVGAGDKIPAVDAIEVSALQ